VHSVIAAESAYNPAAVSVKGAIGLMQLMPETARELDVNPLDPGQNIQGGVSYLKQLLERYSGSQNQLLLALAAYNAGPGAVERYGGLPPYAETHAFVRRVIERFLALAERRAAK
jgi:soluble lytic murein transglycosylase-like protein